MTATPATGERWGAKHSRCDGTARERLVDAAEACFDRLGVASTTVEDVAREAQVSRNTVYRYFAGGRDEPSWPPTSGRAPPSSSTSNRSSVSQAPSPSATGSIVAAAVEGMRGGKYFPASSATRAGPSPRGPSPCRPRSRSWPAGQSARLHRRPAERRAPGHHAARRLHRVAHPDHLLVRHPRQPDRSRRRRSPPPDRGLRLPGTAGRRRRTIRSPAHEGKGPMPSTITAPRSTSPFAVGHDREQDPRAPTWSQPSALGSSRLDASLDVVLRRHLVFGGLGRSPEPGDDKVWEHFERRW